MNLGTVHKVQSQTFAIAREMTGDQRAITPISDSANPPFCLRTVPAHRTPAIQGFRNKVAREVRRRRTQAQIKKAIMDRSGASKSWADDHLEIISC